MLTGVVLLMLVGCGPANYYMLTGSTNVQPRHSKHLPVVGVETISLPEYMQQGKVAIQLSPTQISYSDSGKWAEDMEGSLTKQLISTIQKSFNHPNVYAYPWGLSKQAGLKIKVTISKFIAYGDNVYLDANWEISDLKIGKQYSRLFSVKVPCGKETASVVAAMNVAFGKLSQRVVSDLNRKF